MGSAVGLLAGTGIGYGLGGESRDMLGALGGSMVGFSMAQRRVAGLGAHSHTPNQSEGRTPHVTSHDVLDPRSRG